MNGVRPRKVRAGQRFGRAALGKTGAVGMTPPTVDIDEDSGGRRYATITDSALENLRRLIGVRIENTIEPWCYEVTRDNIRHYAHGIGDNNPLWCDPRYA